MIAAPLEDDFIIYIRGSRAIPFVGVVRELSSSNRGGRKRFTRAKATKTIFFVCDTRGEKEGESCRSRPRRGRGATVLVLRPAFGINDGENLRVNW